MIHSSSSELSIYVQLRSDGYGVVSLSHYCGACFFGFFLLMVLVAVVVVAEERLLLFLACALIRLTT